MAIKIVHPPVYGNGGGIMMRGGFDIVEIPDPTVEELQAEIRKLRGEMEWIRHNYTPRNAFGFRKGFRARALEARKIQRQIRRIKNKGSTG